MRSDQSGLLASALASVMTSLNPAGPLSARVSAAGSGLCRTLRPLADDVGVCQHVSKASRTRRNRGKVVPSVCGIRPWQRVRPWLASWPRAVQAAARASRWN